MLEKLKNNVIISRYSNREPVLKLVEQNSLLSWPFSDTEDASETDLAKHDEDDYVEIKEQ